MKKETKKVLIYVYLATAVFFITLSARLGMTSVDARIVCYCILGNWLIGNIKVYKDDD